MAYDAKVINVLVIAGVMAAMALSQWIGARHATQKALHDENVRKVLQTLWSLNDLSASYNDVLDRSDDAKGDM